MNEKIKQYGKYAVTFIAGGVVALLLAAIPFLAFHAFWGRGSMHRGWGERSMPHIGMQTTMGNMMFGIANKSGADFDKAFLTEMIVHHDGAVEMAKAALSSAEHPELKALAQSIITAQEKEIADMKAWQSAWFGK